MRNFAPLTPSERSTPPVCLDAATFARTRLDFHPDPLQVALLQCDAHQVILNCSRQWGKSTVTAVKAIHRAFTQPGSFIIVASPSERQSAEFLRKIREFARKLRIRLRTDGHNRLSLLLPNQSRIVGLPGREANNRGFSSVHLLIIDEASRVPDDLYKSLRPVLTITQGDIWLLSTPYGKRGFFHHNWEYGGDSWIRFQATALECPRIPPLWLENERVELGDAWFRQEYLCEFITTETQLFSDDLIQAALDKDERPWPL